LFGPKQVSARDTFLYSGQGSTSRKVIYKVRGQNTTNNSPRWQYKEDRGALAALNNTKLIKTSALGGERMNIKEMI